MANLSGTREGPHHYRQQGQHLAAALTALSLICLTWLAIITVQATGKQGKMHRSLVVLLWVSCTLGKGREGTAGFGRPFQGQLWLMDKWPWLCLVGSCGFTPLGRAGSLQRVLLALL